MDTPRRWQVASLATAVASIGIGGALLGRPSVAAVPSIDLDEVVTSEDHEPSGGGDSSEGATEPGRPRIVPPATPDASAASPGTSGEQPPDGGSGTSAPDADTTGPDPTVSAGDGEPATSSPATSADSVDSSVSIDSN